MQRPSLLPSHLSYTLMYRLWKDLSYICLYVPVLFQGSHAPRKTRHIYSRMDALSLEALTHPQIICYAMRHFAFVAVRGDRAPPRPGISLYVLGRVIRLRRRVPTFQWSYRRRGTLKRSLSVTLFLYPSPCPNFHQLAYPAAVFKC